MSSARVDRGSAVTVIVAALSTACSGDADAPRPQDKAAILAQDAGVTGRTAPPRLDPSGLHIDDYVPGAGRPVARRAGRPIEIILKSTPTGANVAVDGINLGTTPRLWQGETGQHEFTFTLPGHALARYRFDVITTGTVHGRLEPVSIETDAGVPPPELVPPITPPSTINDPVGGPTAPPPAPVDAAPPTPPPSLPAPDAAAPSPGSSGPTPPIPF